MNQIRFYLDADAQAHPLVQAMRAHRLDVLTANEAGLPDASDEAQLIFSAAQGRTLVTYNARDFIPLHGRLVQAGGTHAGVIVAEQGRWSLGEMMRRLAAFAANKEPDSVAGRLFFLNSLKSRP